MNVTAPKPTRVFHAPGEGAGPVVQLTPVGMDLAGIAGYRDSATGLTVLLDLSVDLRPVLANRDAVWVITDAPGEGSMHEFPLDTFAAKLAAESDEHDVFDALLVATELSAYLDELITAFQAYYRSHVEEKAPFAMHKATYNFFKLWNGTLDLAADDV